MSFLTTPPNLNLHTAEGWTIPPLDGSISVPELYDFHYRHNPHHPVFVYTNADTDELTHVRYSELVPAAHRAGWYVTKTTNFNHSADMNVRPVVAVLAATGMSPASLQSLKRHIFRHHHLLYDVCGNVPRRDPFLSHIPA